MICFVLFVTDIVFIAFIGKWGFINSHWHNFYINTLDQVDSIENWNEIKNAFVNQLFNIHTAYYSAITLVLYLVMDGVVNRRKKFTCTCLCKVSWQFLTVQKKKNQPLFPFEREMHLATPISLNGDFFNPDLYQITHLYICCMLVRINLPL